MNSSVLVEFDIRIKTREKEEDDLTLIRGATDYCDLTTPSMSFTNRINCDCGAVDNTLARVYNAVEATIDVLILKVQNGFNLSLSLFVFVGGSGQEIPLFHGTTAESCGLRRYVIAVEMDTWLQLKFKDQAPKTTRKAIKKQKIISASRAILSANNKFTTTNIPAITEITTSSKGNNTSSSSKGCTTSKGNNTSSSSKGCTTSKGSENNTSNKTICGSEGFKLSPKHIKYSILW
ncbi:hypothetical protein D1007_38488 [Hordeum vulgare]|nr:hypothetical protein D1007_38488 [Hordeum vulgare]